jgi:hypothetical protein
VAVQATPTTLWSDLGRTTRPSRQPGNSRRTTIQTRAESAWFQRLKLKYDELLPSFAFNVSNITLAARRAAADTPLYKPTQHATDRLHG